MAARVKENPVCVHEGRMMLGINSRLNAPQTAVFRGEGRGVLRYYPTPLHRQPVRPSIQAIHS